MKNRNTINQLYKTQNTFRQSIMNVINNIRKIEKITFNENDNEFKYNILKFVKQSTFKIENTVSNVKNELNQTKNNISFVNHKLFRLENFKDEYLNGSTATADSTGTETPNPSAEVDVTKPSGIPGSPDMVGKSGLVN